MSELTPPYASYTSFVKVIVDVTGGGVPTTIDASVLGNRSGGAKTQILSALRFLGLIDSEGHPTELFGQIGAAGDSRAEVLLPLLKRAYTKAVWKELQHGTPDSLKSAIDEMGGGKLGSVVKDRAYRFVVMAAQDCGVEVSTHLIDSRGRVKGTSPKKKRKKKEPSPEKTGEGAGAPVVQTGNRSWDFNLASGRLSRFSWPEDISRDEIESVFLQLEKLKDLLAAAAPSDEEEVDEDD